MKGVYVMKFKNIRKKVTAALVAASAAAAVITPAVTFGSGTVMAEEKKEVVVSISKDSSVFDLNIKKDGLLNSEVLKTNLEKGKQIAISGIDKIKNLLGGITITTDAPDILSIKNGVITALKEGTANVIAKTSDGAKKVIATIKVTVKDVKNKIDNSNLIKKNGWINKDGNFYYYKNNVAYTGWHWMTEKEGEKTPHWSYFGSDGVLRTGWKMLGVGTNNPDGNKPAHWSYFGPNGWLRTGWQKLGVGTSNPDGNNQAHWSYFGPNGWLRTNWQRMGMGTSNPDGNNRAHWSYFGPNGWLRLGWQYMGKNTNNPDGNTPTHSSYFGGNGWLRTGKQTIGGKVYYFNAQGWLK